MDPLEISRLVNGAVEKLKNSQMGIDFVVKDMDKRGEKVRIPDFNPIYKKTVELRDRIAVHAEFDKIPYDIIRKRGPYEDDLQYQYRKDNWQSITLSSFMKALSKLNRIWNPSNYAIQWDAGQEDEKAYFETDIPTVSSIEEYCEQVLMTEKILDPNALVVIKPYDIPFKEIATETSTQYVLDDSKRVSPIPILVPCTHVVDFMDDRYAVIISEEKSMVKDGNKQTPVAEGLIFEIYDSENIWRVEQIGLKSKWEFSQPYIYYPHGIGYLPCQRLKGILKQKDKRTYYQSYFLYAIPHLDTALYMNSNLDISSVTQLFPQRSELSDECENSQCEGGRVYEYIGDGTGFRRHSSICPSCKGVGGLSRLGPMGTKQIIIKHSDDPTTTPELPGIAYTAPPHEPLEFVFKLIQHHEAKAFAAINIDVGIDDVKGSETALGKMIDRDEFFSFLMRFSNEMFGTMGFIIETIGKMRYGNDFNMPVISAPTSFQMRTEQDLTEELAESKKAGVPDVALREIIRQIISKRFSNLRNIEPAVNLAFAVDRFITLNSIEMNSKLANGTAMKWEAILHDSIYTFMDNALIDNNDFFTSEFTAQKELMVTMAKEKEKEIADSQALPTPAGIAA